MTSLTSPTTSRGNFHIFSPELIVLDPLNVRYDIETNFGVRMPLSRSDMSFQSEREYNFRSGWYGRRTYTPTTTRMEIRTWRSAIADLKSPPPGAPSGALVEGKTGWVWRCDAAISRYHLKTCLFVRFSPLFFHVQPKHPNGAIFVNIEDFRPCLGKPSYGAPQWALMVCLMQKERLKSPHKSLLVIWVIFGKTCHFGHFG